MTPDTIITIGQQALMVLLLVSAPLLLVALVAGPWILSTLIDYIRRLYMQIPTLIG